MTVNEPKVYAPRRMHKQDHATVTNHIDQSSSSKSGGIVPILVQRIGQTTRVTFPTAMPNASGFSELFRRVFRVRRVVAEKTSNNVGLQRTSQSLFVERDGPAGLRMTVAGALEPLVVQLLEMLNLPYTLTGRRPSALATTTDTTDLHLLHAIAANEHLVIRHGQYAVDVACAILQIARSFPAIRIVVIVKHIAEVRRIADRLRAVGIDVARFTSQDRADQSFSRVAVATYQHAGNEQVGLWDTDVVIVENVVDAMSEDGRMAIQSAHRDHPTAPRVIGFAAADFTPSINQYAELLTVYGPVEIVVPRHGAVVREVMYALLPVAGLKSQAAGQDQLDVDNNVGHAKQVAVWRNPIRNRLISRLALGFANGDVEAVGSRFPELVDHLQAGKPVSVLVVVENGVHAANLLHGRLRGWSAVGPEIGRVPPLAPRWGWPVGKPMPSICTFAGLAAMNVANFDVIVRADAGTGTLPLSKNALVTGNSTLPPLLLVDFDDWRDPALAPHAERRRAAYEAAGWVQIGNCREHRELRRFLDRHPQGQKLKRRIEQMAKLIALENRAG